jgi:hypothetical protein
MTETETDDTSSTDPAVLQFENKAALRDYIDDLARETIAKKIGQEIAEKTGQDPPPRTNASEEPDIDLSPTERRQAINAAIAVDGTGFDRWDREDLRDFNDAALATVADTADDLLDENLPTPDDSDDPRTNAAAGEDRLSEKRREQLRSNREAMDERATDGTESGDAPMVPGWLDRSPTDEELRANEQREAREERTREQAEAFYSLAPFQQTVLLNGRETTDPDVERVRANVGLVDEESEEPSDTAGDLPDPSTIADPVERAHVRQKIDEAREARTNASESAERETSLKTPDEVRANVRGEEYDAPAGLETPSEARDRVRGEGTEEPEE